jgi:hypothetical protein
MNNIKLENFILEYNNFIENDFCQKTIEYYCNMEKAGFVGKRTFLENRKKHDIDNSYTSLNSFNTIKLDYVQSISSFFLEKFWKNAYTLYSEKYSVLSTSSEHKIYGIKVQNIKIGEGYHVWHYENASREVSSRLLAFILYLNDVEEGGETEFLYSPKRIRAQQGKLILFPAGFTHTHRGNPPISNEKYILNGWVEF